MHGKEAGFCFLRKKVHRRGGCRRLSVEGNEGWSVKGNKNSRLDQGQKREDCARAAGRQAGIEQGVSCKRQDRNNFHTKTMRSHRYYIWH